MTSGGPGRGQGRKSLPDDSKRSVAVQIRITPAQKRWLDEISAAAFVNCTPSYYLYYKLLRDGMPMLEELDQKGKSSS